MKIDFSCFLINWNNLFISITNSQNIINKIHEILQLKWMQYNFFQVFPNVRNHISFAYHEIWCSAQMINRCRYFRQVITWTQWKRLVNIIWTQKIPPNYLKFISKILNKLLTQLLSNHSFFYPKPFRLVGWWRNISHGSERLTPRLRDGVSPFEVGIL